MVRFLMNNEPVEIQVHDPNMTVLAFLREQMKKTGTKEGCAAGDCGACTVVVASLCNDNQDISYRTINSCIALMSALDGKQLITVEDLARDNELHPVQSAMVKHHASQCGFCTPGFVMSAFSLYHNAANPGREDVVDALSGNLCRCTGYRPIIDATLEACEQPTADHFDDNKAKTLRALIALNEKQDSSDEPRLHMPANREALRAIKHQYPDAPLVAGSTDLALEITQQHRRFSRLISVAKVAELKRVERTSSVLTLGAALPLTQAMAEIVCDYPTLKELFTRFASLPVRNQATLGGNVANASPIGDSPPLLLALDASLKLDGGDTSRHVRVRDFFTGYRTTLLKETEWIDAIELPLPTSNQQIAAYKVSKRMEDDISAVCAVFNITVENNVVTELKTGFGGVAATPAVCAELESSITGKNWNDKATLEAGKTVLEKAFSPIDDVRASASYRKQIVVNLWHRFWLEHQSEGKIETRVVNHA